MTSSDEEVFDRQVTDPLSEVTRVDRRWLLVANVALAAMAYGGIVPSEINALGLKAAQLNRGVIFVIAWMTALYLFVSFALYVATDFKAWETCVLSARRRFIDTMIDESDIVLTQRGEESFRERMASGPDSPDVTARLQEFSDLFDARMRPFQRRARFEMYFPLLVSALNVPAAALFYYWKR